MDNKRKELLKKIKALRDQGTSGEREAAEATLNRLMQKYDIAPEELEESVGRLIWFRYYDDFDRRLLLQTTALVLGAGWDCYTHRNYEGGRTLKEYGAEVTPSQEMELRARMEFYRDAFKEEQNKFFVAFLAKYGIFDPDDNEERRDFTPEQLEEAAKIKNMMQGMEDREFRKQLPDNTSV